MRLHSGFDRLRKALLLLTVFVLGFLIYSNTLESPFVLDDHADIRDNESIRLTRLDLKGLARAGFETLTSGPLPMRCVAQISFALNYYFHDYDVTGFHVVNILIHCLTAVFLCLFVETTMSIPSVQRLYGHPRLVPIFTALIWLANPIQTQSVTYIGQRMNSMAAMFYIMSFFFYARARSATGGSQKWALYFFCALSGLLGLGCKEITATLPFFILLYEWSFIQGADTGWLRRHRILLSTLAGVTALAAVVFWHKHLREIIAVSYPLREFTLIQRLLTEFRVVIYYLSLLAFPHPSRLNLDHDFPLSCSLFSPITTLFAIMTVAGLLGLAGYSIKRNPLLSFCIFWYFGNLVIESSVIPLEIMFEHRAYLPTMLVVFFAVACACKYLRRPALISILSFLVAVSALWTYQRNEAWKSDTVIWLDCVKKSPNKPRPHNNLGQILMRDGALTEAVGSFRKALELDPEYHTAHYNMAKALMDLGRVPEAVRHYNAALRIKPDFAEAHNNLAGIYEQHGMLTDAERHCKEALRIDPELAEAHVTLGNILTKQGDVDGAFGHYYEALRKDPEQAEAHNNLGNLFLKRGAREKAIAHYREALRMDSTLTQVYFNMANAFIQDGRLDEALKCYCCASRLAKAEDSLLQYNMGVVLGRLGRVPDAIAALEEAARINPDYTEAHYNLGIYLKQTGRLDEAMAHYREAVRVKPDYAEAWNNMGGILMQQGKIEEAVEHLSKALAIKPDHEKARQNLNRARVSLNKGKDGTKE